MFFDFLARHLMELFGYLLLFLIVAVILCLFSLPFVLVIGGGWLELMRSMPGLLKRTRFRFSILSFLLLQFGFVFALVITHRSEPMYYLILAGFVCFGVLVLSAILWQDAFTKQRNIRNQLSNNADPINFEFLAEDKKLS